MPVGGFDIFLIDKKISKFILGSNESDPFIKGKFYGADIKQNIFYMIEKKILWKI